MTQLALGILTALLVAECCRVLEWAARRLIKCAARLTHGPTPRAEIRFLEQCGNLDDCQGQIAKFGFALRLLGQGVVDWLHRTTQQSDEPLGASSSQFCRTAAEALCYALHGVDLRGMSRIHRKQVDRHVAQLRNLLRRPVEEFDPEGAAVLLRATAAVCAAHIDDRNERYALNLTQATERHAARLGPCHSAVFVVRRAQAHALLQLGHHQRAEELLRGLQQDEAMSIGPDDPRTFPTRQLLAWTWAEAGRLQEAEAGLRTIAAHISTSPGADLALLRHVQCKLSWVVGRQPGRLGEGVESYDNVILHRIREKGPDQGDTLDARHSKGKLFVHAGDGASAHAVLLALLADRRRVQGRHHADTLETRKYLALANALLQPLSARVHRRAVRELRRVRRIQTRVLVRDHPYTRDTTQWLIKLGRTPER